MVDYEKQDDSDQDKNLEMHSGRNSRAMKSILGSKDHHEQHRHLSVGISHFFSAKNVLIMICKSRCHRSVANANVLVEYVDSLRSTLTLRFFVAFV